MPCCAEGTPDSCPPWSGPRHRRPELSASEGVWTLLEPRGRPPAPRFVHAATMLWGE